MSKLKDNLNTPLWYIIVVLLVLAALIGYGIVFPYIQLTSGIPIDISAYDNPDMWEIVPPIVSYAAKWGAIDIAGAVICLFLGLVCFLLGISRTINKISGKQMYMQGLFLVLFAVYNLSMIESITFKLHPAFLFYVCWITFFIYPIPLFVYYYYYFATAFQKWTWPLLFIPICYTAAAFVMFFAFRLPLDIPCKPYTPLAAVGFVIFLLFGLFGVRQKSMAWFVRAISGFWLGWACYVFIKAQLGYSFYLNNEFKNGVTISAVVIVCFLVFFNTQELVRYKSDVQMLSLQNRLGKESYEQLKAHLREVGGLKHEMRNHISAMQIYLNEGRYEEAQNYLSKFSEQAGFVTDAVYHDNILINAAVRNLLQAAAENNVKVELSLKAAIIHIADPDLHSLLSNILDNALEACAAMPEGIERFINLAVSRRDPYLVIRCENSKSGDILSKGGIIQTKKSERGHGYGLWTIRRIVDAYGGMMSIDYDENIFTVTTALKDE